MVRKPTDMPPSGLQGDDECRDAELALLAAERVGNSRASRTTKETKVSDIAAIAGQLMSYRTLADGGLRITVDLPTTESEHFHALFKEVHCQVAVAPLRAVDLAVQQPQDYGQYAKALRLSVFFGIPEVWKATGSDEQFLEFVRTQKCIARSGVPCDGPIQAAHVWRLKDGFGKGVKGPYAAVPLCAAHHGAQHNGGEGAIGGRAYMEQMAQECRIRWIWSEIKDDIGVASMRDAEPTKVFAWCQKKNIERHLPAAFKDVA